MPDDSAAMAVPEENYLDAVRKHEPYATAKKVANEVGVTRQGADKRLRALEEEGKVRSEMVGNSKFWSVGPAARDRDERT